MSSQRVLVVDDEPIVAEVVSKYLRLEGYDVYTAANGRMALEEYQRLAPDLMILDLMLPEVDGWEVCRRIRAQSNVPIIMLTARGEEADTVLGLGLGADDYVSKPFSPRELIARVKAVLRRHEAPGKMSTETLRVGDLRIDPRSRSVENASTHLELTAKEFDLLFSLAQHPGKVFTREQLLDAVWDYQFAGNLETVTVHIHRLRAKVEKDPTRPRHIKTVWGVGYKLEP